MKNKGLLCIIICGIVFLCGTAADAANPIKLVSGFFKSGEKIEADLRKEYTINEENGPWMICVMTYSGDNAKDNAMELAYELRKRYKIKAYIHERTFDHTKGVDLYNASPLHDLGKVAIPDDILLKQGPLTAAEFEVMKRHSVIGADALQLAMQQSGYSSFLAMSIDIARHHHERFDGQGYPDGLAGLEIPLSAQIVTVTDVFDALTSQRVYKKAVAPDVVKIMIEQDAGRKFNPAIVRAFTQRFNDFIDIYISHRDVPAEPKVAEEVGTEWW
ncbi:hypothetical protein AGMMS50229_21510 [Campylobacterota bacterium]|nr:hypothetical protein AGMMS50229_21510 [Campylobacterota bacterium]